MQKVEAGASPLLSVGVTGIDDILRGGLPANCLYLVTGEPGAGKTTLATQFLLDGVRRGERVLYITLSESKRELQMVAASHGWDMTDIVVCELIPSEGNIGADMQLTVFNPSEIELAETTEAIIAAVNQYQPVRVVIDSLSELRLVAQSTLRYRRQILALKQFLSGKDCTVLLLDDGTGDGSKEQLESIAHGVLVLEQLVNQYGAERRRMRVMKMRGVAFRGGYHDFAIRRGGAGGLSATGRVGTSERISGSRSGQRQRRIGCAAWGWLAIRHEHIAAGPCGLRKIHDRDTVCGCRRQTR